VASITMRNLDDMLKSRLRIQAAVHGRSMENEARDILRSALNHEPTSKGNLVASSRARFSQLCGIELSVIAREPTCKPPYFDE
jgi:plasmid stability protein